MKILKFFLFLQLFLLISCKDNSVNTPEPIENLKVNWQYKATINNHIIAIIKDTTIVSIQNEQLKIDDKIGVFYSKNDSLICAGKVIWNGKTNTITVWADDPTTPIKDGMSDGEEMQWIIYHNNKNYIVYPEYFSGQNKFISGGISKLKKLSTK